MVTSKQMSQKNSVYYQLHDLIGVTCFLQQILNVTDPSSIREGTAALN